MCGIVGVVGSRAERELVETMCSTITHRGPDSDGYYVRSGVALGMRRLSIIDLSTGDQPIHNEDKTIWTVFNGEIYNFQSLRKTLAERGHRFYTQGDTELLVHCYEEFGQELCAPLRGMFAFALWDEVRRELVVARDRLGKKPLYYAQLGDTLLFSSEIKALLRCEGVPREIDPVSLDQYLTLGYVPGPRTMFHRISKLLPGHMMVFSQGRLTVRSYWDVTSQDSSVPRGEREEDWLEWLGSNLQEAVRLRLVSDVPLGAFLSGGLDSSVVVALMRRYVTGPLKTFSVAFDEAGEYDERQHARHVAECLGTEHHELVVRESPLDLLDKVIWHLDEPIADEAAVPTYLLSALARQHVKVVLTGEGADELFAGYGQYQYVQRLNELQTYLPRAVRVAGRGLLAFVPGGGRGGVWVERAHKVLAGLFCATSESFTQYGHLIPACGRESLYSQEFKRFLRSRSEVSDDPRKAYFKNVTSCSALNQALYVDIKTWLPDELLMKVDKMSMANSLEARAPYLDHKLVEGVFRMPDKLKVRKGVFKYILRRWSQPLLPESIWQRPKHAFAVPYREWFTGPLKPLVHDVLSPQKIRNHCLLEPTAVERVVQGYFSSGKQGEKETRVLWALLCLQLWYDLFLTSSRATLALNSCENQAAGAQRW
jgi:asparagine synthase (glutamine-hydrolysing)